MANVFDQSTLLPQPKYSKFDLSYDSKISMNAGPLVPNLFMEIIPGDFVNIRAENFVRLAPMVHPVFHRIDVQQFFFFVPNRLIYKDWESFITGVDQETEEVDETFVPPYAELGALAQYAADPYTGETITAGTLYDFLGLPTSTDPTIAGNLLSSTTKVSLLRARAYQRIYNDWFRDEMLNDKVAFSTDGGQYTYGSDELDELMTLRYRCWERDYFTSATTSPQIGDAVTIPVTMDSNFVNPTFDGSSVTFARNANGSLVSSTHNFLGLSSDGFLIQGVTGDTAAGISQVGSSGVRVDNSKNLLVPTGTASTIEDLRIAYALQRWKERGVFGNRYIEQILTHFGVHSSDARLQRSQYIGSNKQPVVISEVLQTSSTEYDDQSQVISALGEMGGHGISSGSSRRFGTSFEEHGYLVGIINIKPRTAYYQGIPRDMFKFDRFDYYWPEFAQLGQQPIYNKELFANDSTYDDSIFGYNIRYSEYKHHNSEIHGEFRSSMLDWHMARTFDSLPALNGSFVTSEPTNRIFAVTSDSEDHYFVNTWFDIEAIRPMPYNNDRGL